ncbi:MAG: TfoX/Sxy family protein [Candidatus Nanopelagicales bacterium]|jgi:TfoX/Sxy family transcriptional regulator of competence genes
MAVDADLARRLRELLAGERALSEKRMFGGVAFLVGGAMAVCASHEGGLLLRVDPAQRDALLAEPGVDPFVMQGRQMAGWLRVEAEAVQDDEDLERWTERGLAAARAAGPSTKRGR